MVATSRHAAYLARIFIHNYVHLHTEVVLFAFTSLMRLRGALAVLVLDRTRAWMIVALTMAALLQR